MTTKKVKTEAELRKYLKGKWADWIIIDEGINLYEPVNIDRPVILSCSKNGRIFSLHTDTTDHSLFNCTGDIVEFCSMNIAMIPNQAGNSSAIKFNTGSKNCSVHNSIITGFSWGGVWQFDCDKLLVGRTTIEGSGGLSYNYGIWQGGKTNVEPQSLTMLNCNVSKVRHAIGAHYGKNSYYAIGNTISTLKHSFDRHNSNDGTKRGGMHHVISKNTFLDPDRLAFSIATPYEGGSLVFIGNTLNHARERHIGEVESLISTRLLYEGDNEPGMMIHGNKFTDS